ncbi:uncharacterized protein HMPREF1541_01003 [Cyphellophora europaea CBS 101466]|uniref:Delta(24)-sterol reductase n=1 Tax=Cyphellophora europaea (strain CBS 101466) TaxID=1220924 RepID=W2SFZ6_CYPE1|nr:uncharacterized protein HMPREF1541_01003 [Cyphellophora europaea CBS 101466]ETN46814.1 hypothetical protein HMPREF1541_01003 [Cyphellophora europaea CBS 101466]
MSDLQSQHDKDVAEIAVKVKEFHKNQKPFRIYHGTTGSTRPMAFKAGTFIDTQKLNRTFPVDKEKMTIKVEPKVAMDELVAVTQKQGFLPQVVPELMGITAGGAFSGTAGESSSYKHGLFEETVCEIEIIVGDGSIVTANASSNSDLFEWAGSSMGTLGIITLLEVKLVPAKKYVQLELKRANGINDAMDKIEAAIADPSNDFIDGMLFNKDYGVVMFGKLTDKPEGAEIHSFVNRNEPWFSNYIEKVGSNKSADPKPIALPVDQYFFRYDRGVFWGAKLAFDYFHVPFNRVTRWALDPLMGSRVAYHALHEGGFASKYVVQDFDMPRSKAGPFVDYINSILPNYQFWLCPAKNGKDLHVMNKFRAPSGDEEKRRIMQEDRIYNVGVYGKGTNDFDQFVKLNREIEQKLWHEFCGVKILYAHAYYTEEEFWEIYNREPYDLVRNKYNSQGLPTVYDKISQDMQSGRKPPKVLAGTRGAVKAFLGLLSSKRRTSFLLDKRQGGTASQTPQPAAKKAEDKDAKKEVNGVNGAAEKGPVNDQKTSNEQQQVNGVKKEEPAAAVAPVAAPTAVAASATSSSAANGDVKDPATLAGPGIERPPPPVKGESAFAIPLPDGDASESTALHGHSAIEKPVQVTAVGGGDDPVAAADDLFDKAVEAKAGAVAGADAAVVNGEGKA